MEKVGIELLLQWGERYTAIDKIGEVIEKLSLKFPKAKFLKSNIPPFSKIGLNEFDTVVSFQVIEHIKNDLNFLKEIHRVLKLCFSFLLHLFDFFIGKSR